jgi:PRTRC genetic system protein B
MQSLSNNGHGDHAALKWAVPEELGIPPDPLRLRLDFHHQAVTLTDFEGDIVNSRLVSAYDVAEALASELNLASGLLPENTLWWKNSRSGPVFAIYVKPDVRILAVQHDPRKPAHRYKIPLPGLIFLCIPGREPWIYAVKKKPTKANDLVFAAPLLNVFANGRTCPGSNQYPEKVEKIIEQFFISFFTSEAALKNRSKKHPDDIEKLWKELEKKSKYPLEDLIQTGTVEDLIKMGMG